MTKARLSEKIACQKNQEEIFLIQYDINELMRNQEYTEQALLYFCENKLREHARKTRQKISISWRKL